MNKLFTKIAALLLGGAMVVGVGVSVGSKKVSSAEATSETFTFGNDINTNASCANRSAADMEAVYPAPTGIEWDSCSNAGLTEGKAIKIATNSGNGYVQLKLSDNTNYISSITVTYDTSKGGYNLYVNGGSTAETGTNNVFTFDSTDAVTAFKISKTGSKALYLKSLVIEYESGGGGGSPTLSSIAVKTAPTKISYNVGDHFDPTGLVITKTLSDSSSEDFAYSGNESSFTFDPSTSAALTTSNTSVTITVGGKSCSQAISVTEPVVSGTFNKYSGVISEGDYILTYDNNAINTTISSKRLQYTAVTPSNNSISNPVASIVWHLAKSGDYWTIYNSTIEQYAGSTSAKNEAALLDDVSDNAKWTVSGSSTYDFENLARSTGSDSGNKWLRKNGTYGFACYASGTGGALTLYKKHVAYTIVYNSNGGGSEIMQNSETVVSECGYSAPSGQEFDHWSTSSTDQGTSYAPGDSVSASCTLYAIWKDKVASVSVEPTAIALEVGGSTKTVTATPTNIDNVTYQWARSSGDDCISLTNATSDTVTVAVKSGYTSSGNCVLTVTASGKLGNTNVQRTADVAVSVTKTSTESNPYTVSEAVTFATAQGTTQSGTLAYVQGYLAIKNQTGSQLFLTDDPDSIDITKTYSDEEKHAMLCVYKSGGVTNIGSVSVGDQVKISGYPVLYSGNQPEFADGSCYSSVAETIVVSKSVASESLTINTPFSYGGVVSVDYTHKTDISNANELVTFSGYDMSTAGNQTVTISYTDAKLGKTETTTYTLTVSYASVSSVTLDKHIATIEPVSSTNFTVSLNADVDPSTSASWSVDNDTGSSLDLSKYTIASTGNLTATLTAAGGSSDTGRLIVTATVGGISDTCTVTVTGDPYATFNKASIEGIVGATLNNQVTATPVGLSGTPSSYTWSVTSGSDVVGVSGSTATATLTFKKAGQATVHVSISDGGAKPATGDIEVNVIASLNSIVIPGEAAEYNDSITFADVCEADAVFDDATISDATEFDVYFNKGTNSNKPVYKTTGSAIRVYGGGYFTVSSSHTMSKIELTFGSGDGSNGISTEVGSFSTNTWTGSSASVKFTIGGTTGHRRVAGIKIYWEVAGSDVTISNTDYQAQKAVIEFAEDLTSKLNAVCDADGNTTITGEGGLDAYWTAILGTYNTKKTESGNATLFNQLIANCTKSDAVDADPLQKALSSYDYVCAKYGAQLTSGDFLHEYAGRAAAHYPSIVNPISLFGGAESTGTAIIVIVSVIGVSALGGFFFLRKRKEI